jgi:CDP-6-deoxy-D-xylo-4-hexulose-3-dehydrase
MFKKRIDRIEYGGAMCGSEEREAMLRIYDSQGGKRWTIGPESEALEVELANTTRVKRAVVVNSGSSALLLAVAALKLPPESLIAIPALNFPTAFNAIIQNGHIPVVIDCDKNMLLDLNALKEVVEVEDIAAVIAVHVASNPVDLIKLRKIVGSKVKIISDNCDGYGTKLNGKFIDTYADLSCVSFHAAHIITMGEGGAILTNDNKLADAAKKMREWGRASGTDKIYTYPGFPDDYRERYVYEEIGYNLKPLELQCAIGRIQLKKLEKFKQARAKNYQRLQKVFSKLQLFETVNTIKGADVCWFSFPFYCRGIARKDVMSTLEANNIECRTIFSGNITKHPAYDGINMSVPFKLTHADDVMENGVFISVHPSITQEMIDFIGEVLKSL